ncbi:MAG TPA: hypothetical protein VF791_13005 [Pyrinomonadaceae bacterium]
MRRQLPHLSLFGLLLLLIVSAGSSARAQSSIFNVPTTDTLPPQKLLVEADYIAHPASYEKGGFHYYGPTIIYGLRRNVEIGLNFYITRSAEPAAMELQPNVKWRFYSDEETGFAAAAGGLLIVPLRNRETTKTKALLYLALSKQIKGRFGPRFTSGAYTLAGPIGEDENRTGLLLGYEQPLPKKLTFVSDWYSGYNYFGYAAAGIGITLPKDSYFYAGYSFGNKGRGNNWLSLYYGRIF